MIQSEIERVLEHLRAGQCTRKDRAHEVRDGLLSPVSYLCTRWKFSAVDCVGVGSAEGDLSDNQDPAGTPRRGVRTKVGR